MKAQTKFMSMVESWTNIATGVVLQVGANFALLPVIFHVDSGKAAGGVFLFAGAMTVLSLVRSYGLRRVFERLRQRGTPPDFQHVIEEIAKERLRQIEGEGFSLEHDDAIEDGSLASAAAAYAYFASLPWAKRQLVHLDFDGTIIDPGNIDPGAHVLAALWQRPRGAFKPINKRRDLIKAAAMIVAEIGRIDRARKLTRTLTAEAA